MTIENDLYGAGWHKCGRCGVKDRDDQLSRVRGAEQTGGEAWEHNTSKPDARPCAEWKATLAAAKPSDLKHIESPVMAAYRARREVKSAALEQLKVRPVVDVDLDFATGPRPTVKP